MTPTTATTAPASERAPGRSPFEPVGERNDQQGRHRRDRKHDPGRRGLQRPLKKTDANRRTRKAVQYHPSRSRRSRARPWTAPTAGTGLAGLSKYRPQHRNHHNQKTAQNPLVRRGPSIDLLAHCGGGGIGLPAQHRPVALAERGKGPKPDASAARPSGNRLTPLRQQGQCHPAQDQAVRTRSGPGTRLVPSQNHSIPAANGAARQLIIRALSRGPSRGNA